MARSDSTTATRFSDDMLWQVDRQQWTSYFEQHLHDRLMWAKRYIEETHQQPAELKQHVASLFTMLQQAYRRPSLHSLAVDVIAALQPWPSRWGLWREEEQALRFAVEVCSQLGEKVRQSLFLGYLAHILFYTGRLDEAAAVGETAVLFARQSGAALALAYGGNVMISRLSVAGRLEEAQTVMSGLLSDALIRKVEDETQVTASAMLRLEQAELLRRQGHLHEAVAEVTKVISLLEALSEHEKDAYLIAHAHRDRSVMSLTLGDYWTAAADLNHAQVIFTQEGDTFAQALALSSLGLLYWNMGELVQAETTIRRGIELNQELDALWQLVQDIGNLGLVYLNQGKLQQAIRCFEDQRERGIRCGEIKESKRAIGNRGSARLFLGDYEAAKQDLEEDLAFFTEQKYQAYLGCTLVHLSWCYDALGQQEKALAFVEQASALGEQTGSLALQIVALRCLAEYQSPQTKAEYLRQALILAENRRRFDEAACLLSLAGTMDDIGEQATVWTRGCQMLEEMQASAWVKDRQPHQPPRLPLLY